MPLLDSGSQPLSSSPGRLRRERAVAAWAVMAAIALGGVLFAPVLSSQTVFGFRDGADYYYPLFKHVGQMWAGGQVPLWNPFADLGRPLAGDPTSSVFYPPKLLFAAPLPYPLLYNLFLIVHWALALAGMYALARCCGAGTTASTAAAMGYACSGAVLFNVYNAPYLIGAAWLPLVLAAAETMVRNRTVSSALMLGTAWAMIVLGGDIQAAYHGALLAAAWIALRVFVRRGDSCEPLCGVDPRTAASVANAAGVRQAPAETHQSRQESDGRAASAPRRSRSAAARLGLIVLAAAVGLGLSAVQWLPSWEAAAHSTRARWTYAERLAGHTSADTYSDDVFHFSVGPWRWTEFLLPNGYGRQFPVHQRWIDALPSEGRVWTPSLYFGLPGLLAAMAALCARRSRRWDAVEIFAATAAALALLGACGWFGPVWFAQQCSLAGELPPPLGGVYWLLSLLPGYGQFRYPAKLLSVAALGLSILAAKGFDDWFSRRRPLKRRSLAVLAGIGIVGGLAWWALKSQFLAAAEAVPADPVFGPLDANGAWGDTLSAFVHLALAALALALILPRRTADRQPGDANGEPVAARDRNLAANAENNTAGEPSGEVSDQSAAHSGDKGDACWASSWRCCLLLALVAVDLAAAQRWMIVGVPAALIEPAPKREDSGVPPRLAAPESYLDPRWRERSSADRLAEVARRHSELPRPNLNLTARMAVISGEGALVCADFADELRRLGPGPFAAEGWTASTRAWLVERPDEVDAGRQKGVESLGRAHVWQYGPHQVVVAVESTGPAWLVVAEQYAPGWQALRQSVEKTQHQPLPIERVGKIFRGVYLPTAGKQTIVFRYQPPLWRIGAGVSVGSALLLLTAAGVIYRRSRRREP